MVGAMLLQDAFDGVLYPDTVSEVSWRDMVPAMFQKDAFGGAPGRLIEGGLFSVK